MREVLVVESLAKHYRRPLYDGLHADLEREGVRFVLAYGAPPPAEATKQDNITPDPRYARGVRTRWFLGERAVYLDVHSLAARADLVVLGHQNKDLANIPLLVRRARRPRLAFWGHGRSAHASPRSPAEILKACQLRLVDWYFAYTQGVANYLVGRGFPPQRITVLNNTIDTTAFRADLTAVR